MDKLYAPWRDRYVHQAIKGDQSASCVFCLVFNDDESNQERFVLWKSDEVAVLLNLYPYNGGHLLIIPKNHCPEFDQLSSQENSALMQASVKSMKIMKHVLQPEGMNFGANIGRAAGAGIPDHVHLHLVPRFAGDTGFFTTIGNGKQVSVDLEKIYKKLKPEFDKNFVG
jgi:ATP adenylyltransferase